MHLLHDSLSLPAPPKPKNLLELPTITDRNNHADEDDDDRPKLISRGRELDQTVLHIQSPTLRTTYIHCPPTPKKAPLDLASDTNVDVLGIKHPWVHLQVRDLGRDWGFEVGLVDHAGRTGVVRCSTFQVNMLLWTCFNVNNALQNILNPQILSSETVELDISILLVPRKL